MLPPLLLASALAAPPESLCSNPLLRLDQEGRALHGTKDAVVSAFRAGLPLRVSWSLDGDGDGSPDVSHWADAGFLTEFEGHVFAQLDDIQRQAPRRGEGRIELPPGGLRWTGLLGTSGVLESHFDDGRDASTHQVASEWCIDDRASACATPAWRLVYRHDADGRALSGTKEALFDSVRRGYPLRLSWGFEASVEGRTIAVEHSAEPAFVTIMNGGDLFAQLPEHIAQASYFEPEKALFENPSVMWRGLLGTNGAFDAVFVDRATGREVRRLPQRAGVAWFALAPAEACAPPPLELAVPGGVRRSP
jgi:hypothetical protein